MSHTSALTQAEFTIKIFSTKIYFYNYTLLLSNVVVKQYDKYTVKRRQRRHIRLRIPYTQPLRVLKIHKHFSLYTYLHRPIHCNGILNEASNPSSFILCKYAREYEEYPLARSLARARAEIQNKWTQERARSAFTAPAR